MNCHTKFARLSRPAMTSQHGRLLQDSGFTKQDLTRALSRASARTTIPPLGGSCFPSGTVTGRSSSGRPAIQSIRRTAGRSTYHQVFREILFMHHFGMTEEQLRATVLPKISSPLSKLESRVEQLVTRSWEPVFPSIQSHSLLRRDYQYFSGSIPIKRAEMQAIAYGDNFDLSALSQYP